MTLRRDHVAGGGVVAVAAGVLALSGDLPIGTLASPGPGLLPILLAGLVLVLGAAVLLQAGSSPPFGDLVWPDLPHAVRVVAVIAVASFAYERLGFIITMAGVLAILLYGVERRPLVPALALSLGVPVAAYLLLSKLLKSPLPIGILGF
jgi:putative tricarboxylic transport membrane protein